MDEAEDNVCVCVCCEGLCDEWLIALRILWSRNPSNALCIYMLSSWFLQTLWWHGGVYLTKKRHWIHRFSSGLKLYPKLPLQLFFHAFEWRIFLKIFASLGVVWIIKDTLEFHSADGERAVMPVGNTHEAWTREKTRHFRIWDRTEWIKKSIWNA